MEVTCFVHIQIMHLPPQGAAPRASSRADRPFFQRSNITSMAAPAGVSAASRVVKPKTPLLLNFFSPWPLPLAPGHLSMAPGPCPSKAAPLRVRPPRPMRAPECRCSAWRRACPHWAVRGLTATRCTRACNALLRPRAASSTTRCGGSDTARPGCTLRLQVPSSCHQQPSSCPPAACLQAHALLKGLEQGQEDQGHGHVGGDTARRVGGVELRVS